MNLRKWVREFPLEGFKTILALLLGSRTPKLDFFGIIGSLQAILSTGMYGQTVRQIAKNRCS